MVLDYLGCPGDKAVYRSFYVAICNCLCCVQCILWNTATGDRLNVIAVHPDTIFSLSWNLDGSFFATTCKDKQIRVVDPRRGTVVAVWLIVLIVFYAFTCSIDAAEHTVFLTFLSKHARVWVTAYCVFDISVQACTCLSDSMCFPRQGWSVVGHVTCVNFGTRLYF